MPELRELTADDVTFHQDALVDLLCDAVDSGASIGFLPPILRNEANSYWESVAKAMRGGGRVLIVAFDAKRYRRRSATCLEMRANGSHRAEVMKLMVHRKARRKGLAGS